MDNKNNKEKVAIIGYGYVGKAMHKIFPDAILYDKEQNLNTLDEVNQCGLAIICVPTPMKEDSSKEFKEADISIVEEVVGWIKTPLILIKSTIPPTTTDYLIKKTDKKICFSPEYVGEGKYQITPWKYPDPKDPRLHDFFIIGGEKETREKICNFFVNKLGPEKTYYLVNAVEAEIIKYMENSFLALKVIFAQEFYELCQKLDASYIKVREGWALDKRVDKSHTAVFVDNKGFAGKCLPKDLNEIVSKGESLGADMSLIKTILRKNTKTTN